MRHGILNVGKENCMEEEEEIGNLKVRKNPKVLDWY